MLKTIESQNQDIKAKLDTKLYELVGKLYNHGFNAERFDKVEDYTKQIAIIPVSAKTGDGIPELLMVLTGLAQRFLEESLKINTKISGRGVILEVKDEKGIGTYLDTIIYDGNIKVNDQIVIGHLGSPIITKVRSIFDGKKTVKIVEAACSMRIMAQNIKDAIPGMPLIVANINLEKAKKEVQEEVEEVIINNDKQGLIIKADSLGSLEALIALLKERKIPIRKASIGDVNKKDIAEAESQKDPLSRVILGFNIKEVKTTIPVIVHDVIYKIIDDYERLRENKRKELENKELSTLVRPCKFLIMPGYIFRQNNPAVVGIDLLIGILKTNTKLMKKNGNSIGIVKSIQIDGKNVNEIKAKNQVAIALPDVIVTRHIFEGDTIYSDIPEDDFKKLKSIKKFLNEQEMEVLKEIAEIKRRQNHLWGV